MAAKGSTNISSRRDPFVLKAALVARIHTCLAYTAFSVALGVACLCHYKKVVKNDVAGYPQEWFPSVSATIGDWYPERNIFQILIALTAGPRLALVLFQYYLHYSSSSSLPTVVFVFGLIRTISCGGWVYITSSDDHDAHDVFMITYMVCNIPWMIGGISCTPTNNVSVRKKRIFVAAGFFLSIVPLVYFFIQHKVHRIPGAYTNYSFFEWGLIILDVLYDAVAEQEFSEANLQISLCPPTSAPRFTTSEKTPSDFVAASINGKTPENFGPSVTTEIHKTPMKLSPTPSEWRSAVSFLSDVYLSYIFWSIFTSLIPTLFYFSVWELGIAGHELALLSTLSPVLLSIPPFFQWSRTRGGQATLHLLSFCGLAAHVLERPVHRLFAVAGAIIPLVTRQVVTWTSTASAENAGYQGTLVGLGLLLASLSKHLNHSNNPLWPFVNPKDAVYNKAGLALGLLAVYETYHRPLIPTGNSSSNTITKRTTIPKHWLTSAIPLGSLVFCLHNLVSDPSTLIAWSWTGYQNGRPKGPVPHLHGSLTLIVQCIGLLIPTILSSISSTSLETSGLLMHPIWFAYGSISSYIMYRYRDWAGYAGGLNVALFLMSVTPYIVQRAAQAGAPAKIYFTAFLVYCVLNLASIFTVAYAFVPGGVYLRERTDCVVLCQLACLAFAFEWSRASGKHVPCRLTGSTARLCKTLLAIVSTLSVLGTLYRWPNIPQPFKPGPRVFNAGIWTLHFGIDNTGRDSQRGVADLVRDMELDVVGFLETDLHRTAFGHRDMTRVAVGELGYYVDIGPGPNSHTWGAVLLSKFPIINSTHHLLPSPHGELAPAIEAVLDVYGTEITVIVSHNGQEEDPLDRELQSKELGRIMAASYPRPVVFLGYVVTKPQAERPAPYKFLVEDGRVYDIDQEDEDRWCEYILYRGLYRTAYARVSRGIITDTELQIGQFTLPKHGVGVTNETEPGRYLRSFKEELPIHHWFPMAYYGSEGKGGVNGHFYHVFETPLYYNLPEGAVL